MTVGHWISLTENFIYGNMHTSGRVPASPWDGRVPALEKEGFALLFYFLGLKSQSEK